MIRPVKVEPREGFRIWIRYADGASGVVDLSPLAGRGVFAAWNDQRFFQDHTHSRQTSEAYKPGPATSNICPDALERTNRAGRIAPERLAGVNVNRRDLIAIPVQGC